MDRRTFLGWAGAVSGASLVGGPSLLSGLTRSDSGPVLIAPETLGLQLYTVRDLMSEDVESTLEFVARVGYREVEFAGYFGRSPRHVRTTLDGLGLTAPSMHTDLGGLSSLDETLEAAQVIGHKYVVVAWIPPEQRSSLNDYMRIAGRLNEAGDRAARAGIQLAVHNQAYDFQRMDGDLPYDVLLDECDPGLVEMQADLFWMRRGGVDPIEYFRAWPGRFSSCHVKDMDAEGRMVTVGEGVMDFERIFQNAEVAGLKHYFVEHDEPADSRAAITLSLRNLRSGA